MSWILPFVPQEDLIEEYKRKLKHMEYAIRPSSKDYKVSGNLILVPVPGCTATGIDIEHKDQSLVVSYKSDFGSNIVVINDAIIKNEMISAKVKNGLLVMEFSVAKHIKIKIEDE